MSVFARVREGRAPRAWLRHASPVCWARLCTAPDAASAKARSPALGRERRRGDAAPRVLEHLHVPSELELPIGRRVGRAATAGREPASTKQAHALMLLSLIQEARGTPNCMMKGALWRRGEVGGRSREGDLVRAAGALEHDKAVGSGLRDERPAVRRRVRVLHLDGGLTDLIGCVGGRRLRGCRADVVPAHVCRSRAAGPRRRVFSCALLPKRGTVSEVESSACAARLTWP